MKHEETKRVEKVEEAPDEWWYRVYAAVIITTIVVITALWIFTKTFS